MAESKPIDAEDVELLRWTHTHAHGLAEHELQRLDALAEALADVAALPASERGARAQAVLALPDVELVRGAATRLSQTNREDAREEVARLYALALKLAAYLPPRNGG